MIEGDIALGFGAGKGYGSCLAKVRGVRWPTWESIPEVFREGLQNGDFAGLMEGGAVTRALKGRLSHWFGDLKRSAERSVKNVS